ncbi:MAG: VOC family protein [Pirellulaceae bacterium]
MTQKRAPEVGTIGWFDLTVADAETIRDFYAAVVGWQATPVDMQGYQDYCMTLPGSGETMAGICHKRGVNAALPPQWLLYITVDNLDHSVAQVTALGGQVVVPPRGSAEHGRFCVIRDPAGAVSALYEAARSPASS